MFNLVFLLTLIVIYSLVFLPLLILMVVIFFREVGSELFSTVGHMNINIKIVTL